MRLHLPHGEDSMGFHSKATNGTPVQGRCESKTIMCLPRGFISSAIWQAEPGRRRGAPAINIYKHEEARRQLRPKVDPPTLPQPRSKGGLRRQWPCRDTMRSQDGQQWPSYL